MGGISVFLRLASAYRTTKEGCMMEYNASGHLQTQAEHIEALINERDGCSTLSR